MAGSTPISGKVRGRGAKSNRTGRFESLCREDFHDGWETTCETEFNLKTTLTAEHPRRLISRNDSPDISFAQSVNPYRGCEHGCIYCYARPGHAFAGLSPGLDFETRLFFKASAAATLRRELKNPRYQVRPIHVGGSTDPYQPAERRLRVTREILEVLEATRHPFSIITKSRLITRDADLIGRMGAVRLARAAVSITTLDRALARAMEPRAPTPSRRLDAVEALARAGAPVSVMFAPVIPGLNDHELEGVLESAAAAGAVGAGYVMLRLPLELKEMFREWLKAEYPDRARRVISLIRQMRGGIDYDARWGRRMKGEGPLAEAFAKRFAIARRRFGLDAPTPPFDLESFTGSFPGPFQPDLFANVQAS